MTRILSLAVLAALFISPALQAQTTTDTGQETAATTDTTTTAKTFDELSAGNQKIARALMDAQLAPHETNVQIWTLDQIAAAGSEKGWGQAFQEMQSEGLISAKNLGQVVSSYQRNMNTAVTASEQNTAIGQGSAAEEHIHSPGKENSHGAITASGLSGSASGTGIANANGNAFGHEPDLPARVDHGITTASGAGASIGFEHALDAGAAGLSVHGGVNAGGHAIGRGR